MFKQPSRQRQPWEPHIPEVTPTMSPEDAAEWVKVTLIDPKIDALPVWERSELIELRSKSPYDPSFKTYANGELTGMITSLTSELNGMEVGHGKVELQHWPLSDREEFLDKSRELRDCNIVRNVFKHLPSSPPSGVHRQERIDRFR